MTKTSRYAAVCCVELFFAARPTPFLASFFRWCFLQKLGTRLQREPWPSYAQYLKCLRGCSAALCSTVSIGETFRLFPTLSLRHRSLRCRLSTPRLVCWFGWFVLCGVVGAVGDIPGMTARDTLLPSVVEHDGLELQKFMGVAQSVRQPGGHRWPRRGVARHGPSRVDEYLVADGGHVAGRSRGHAVRAARGGRSPKAGAGRRGEAGLVRTAVESTKDRARALRKRCRAACVGGAGHADRHCDGELSGYGTACVLHAGERPDASGLRAFGHVDRRACWLASLCEVRLCA